MLQTYETIFEFSMFFHPFFLGDEFLLLCIGKKMKCVLTIFFVDG